MLRSHMAILAVVFLSPTHVLAQAKQSVLYNFGSNSGDPIWAREIGAIVVGKDGNFYSAANQGGKMGYGAVYKMTPAGQLTVLYSFDGPHGNGPWGGLSMASDGNLYGTTYGGGKPAVGTIFKITPEGQLTSLYSFQNGPDGAYPISPPVQAKDGNLYGVTSYASNQQYGCIYKITPAGSFSKLYTFNFNDVKKNGTLGASVAAGSDGNLYVTTLKGGLGWGTVLKVTPSGAVTCLHQFDNVHGAGSYNLTQGNDGNLYGTAYAGGSGNSGVVYKLTTAGDYKVIHNFIASDGLNPYAGVVQATDGNLYGTTKYGGSTGRGVIYRVSTDGSNFAVVYTFAVNMLNGRYCVQTPVQHPNGKLYGDTYSGGTKDGGVFYCLDAGLKPKQ